MRTLRSIEICAGAGGQALGLEQAGFEHDALVEIDRHACDTLRLNRTHWNVVEADLKDFQAFQYEGIDLLAGGVPCPPFSVAGKQLGADDERDLFPEALRLVEECLPKAVMLENVRGIFDPSFSLYREQVLSRLKKLGYEGRWRLLNASSYGVSQLRPRAVLVALREDIAPNFLWPDPETTTPPTVGEKLYDLMASNGWKGAKSWKQTACKIAPTIVGGSKKHGGPDLGPTRARKAWLELGVDGSTVSDTAPAADFDGVPKLTVRMVARLQGFPDDWQFSGRKTPAYRQIGNAFPPPVARAVGLEIAQAIRRTEMFSLLDTDYPWQSETVHERSLESIF